MKILFLNTILAVLCLGAFLLVTGALVPRGQPLPNADKIEEMIHSGLFPDKPREMSFKEYFENFTDPDGNLTAALEKLEFGVLDFDNLETAIRLAEDARRLQELKVDKKTRRADPIRPAKIFSFKENPSAWTLQQRSKLFQFMQHSVYSTRYEINKMRIIRHKYRNSTVFRMGLRHGNNLELKTVAGQLYTTLSRMHYNNSMLWYLFHYHKLLNMNYDVATNVEYIFLMQKTLDDGFLHLTASPPLPSDPDTFTSRDPENLYKK